MDSTLVTHTSFTLGLSKGKALRRRVVLLQSISKKGHRNCQKGAHQKCCERHTYSALLRTGRIRGGYLPLSAATIRWVRWSIPRCRFRIPWGNHLQLIRSEYNVYYVGSRKMWCAPFFVIPVLFFSFRLHKVGHSIQTASRRRVMLERVPRLELRRLAPNRFKTFW